MTMQEDGAVSAVEVPTSQRVAVVRIDDDGRHDADDALAQEVAVALEFNGISYATMLATPADLEDFALGFALTEGLVAGSHEVRGVDVLPGEAGIVVQIEIATEREAGMKARRRAMAGRTGCGLCGVESLDQVIRPVRQQPRPPATVSRAVLTRAFSAMRQRQVLHDLTGATHGAALIDAQGELVTVREDVGRHNALDKLIGAMLREGRAPDGCIALVSSRASYEMVQKTASAGIGVLAAVSAPTALAVRLAEDNGLTLIGFMRGGQCVVYTHAQRVVD